MRIFATLACALAVCGIGPSESSTLAAEASAQAGKPKAKGDEKSRGGRAAALGVTGPLATSGEGRKPWQVMATVGQTLGAGVLVASEDAQTVAYGWNFDFSGTYRLTKLFEGELIAALAWGFDQQLTASTVDLGTVPRELYLRDLRLSLLGRSLYREKWSDFILGGRIDLALPTSQQAQAVGRILRADVRLDLIREFVGVGPGDLLLLLSTSFRKDFGDDAGFDRGEAFRTGTYCRSIETVVSGDCQGGAALDFALIHRISLAYAIGNFSTTLAVVLFNNFFHDISNSDIATTPDGRVIDQSPFVSNSADQRDNLFTFIRFAYLFLDNWSVGTGVSSLFDSPFVQNGDNSSSLRFPFFDTQTTSRNATTFFLDLSFMY
jgi:hypothetical protein